jgi:hypothetical protein
MQPSDVIDMTVGSNYRESPKPSFLMFSEIALQEQPRPESMRASSSPAINQVNTAISLVRDFRTAYQVNPVKDLIRVWHATSLSSLELKSF